jgi:ATP-binding cassette subfamily B protein
VLTFFIVAGIVIALQPVIGLVVIMPLTFAFIVIRKFNREVREVYQKLRAQLGEIGTFVHDRLGGVQLIQGFGREKEETRLFAGAVGGHYRNALRALRMRCLFFPLVGLGGFLSNVFMLGLGVWFIWRGEFTLGGLIAYRGYWWRLQSPINSLARMSDTLQRARASAERVMGLLAEPVEIVNQPGARAPETMRGELEFVGVDFAYQPDKPILRGVGFRVAPGEFVAIAGASGAGKSTLLGLVPRFFDVTAGAVRVDGLDVREWELHSLRRRMGLVQQETYLFNETIAENIRYPRPDATDEEVVQAARQANAHGFIEGLPQGYATRVGERGVKLSGGQKQRLSLARAFLSNPAILLLDEPTSAVEPESEELIAAAIVALARERTTLLVTHRVSLLQRAPRILFFHAGMLLADGSHRDLLRTCPDYARSYSLWVAEEAEAR